MSRNLRPGLLLAAVALLLLAADGVAWWLATGRMITELAAWQQARAAQGMAVLASPARRGGWPFEAELVVPGVTIATDMPGEPDAIAWQAGQVRLVYQPWHPATLRIVVEGNQTLRFGPAPPLSLLVGPIEASIPLDAAGQAQGVVVQARDVVIPAAGGPIQFGSLDIRVRQMDGFATITSATLPGRSLPFGGTIQSLELHARFSGPIPPLRDPAAALTAWRDSGSRLLVDNAVLRWGPLDVRGNASLGLDRAMQPEGSASVQLTGYADVIEALARSGAITRNDARVAATLLGLMSRPGTGDVAEADLPITLRDRTISVGAIPLMRVPMIAVP